ncbi:dTDP-4-dehydrorhamnose reductase [Polynucleobacter paludilacus]|uniref:dTDP-4-dehydrorhamnose reductase n=1 Tax=Polynucleobacter paludilacus TaxID=1855895 RepID=UPI001BFE902B|nr:dTDP-4-dehydrorhamnose reductase [Polynucleobacter paludilacus]QWD87251.1 dTDP-4-dehydrorhamnose reductase [Polynucleobacter paludilacus]
MKVLVFGAGGQLGKAFHALLSARKDLDVKCVGRAECDLTDPLAMTQVLEQSQAQLIINAAAYTAVDQAETDTESAYAVNAHAPEVMAQYAAKHKATFLHYSTDYVFDGSKLGFYLEDDVCNPLGVYGKSKRAGEVAIQKVFESSPAGQYAILRTSWVYGDGGNFIRTILRLAKEREELKVINDQYGVPTSAAWLACISLELVLDAHSQIKTFPSGIYHAVPAGEATWYGLATQVLHSAIEAGMILKLKPEAVKPIPAIEYPLPAPRPQNSRMGTQKLRIVLADKKPNDSSSYNETAQISAFPDWRKMVKKYVKDLSAK